MGDVEDYPRPKRKQKLTFEVRVALRIDLPDGRFLLERRPFDGLLGGLWELPGRTVSVGSTAARALGGLVSDLEQDASDLGPPVPVGRVEHRFSHRHWTVHVYQAVAGTPPRAAGTPSYAADGPERRWIDAEELPELGLPTVSRKAIDLSACNQSLR